MTRFSVRCLALALALSCCFAVFTIGVSAADAPSGSGAWAHRIASTGITTNTTVSLGESKLVNGRFSAMSFNSLVLVAPSAGTMTVSITPCSSNFSASGSGSASSVSATYSGTTATVTVVFDSSGSAGINVNPVNNPTSSSGSETCSLTLVSWAPEGIGGGGDHSGSTTLGPSSGGFNGWNSDGTFSGGQTVTGSSQKWEINSTYIGQLDYYITDEVGSTPAIVYIAKNLANLTHDSWSWKVNPDGTFTYVRPNPGSWLDNMWQMNIYLYYNLANQKGWFGHINSEFATLNSRVLQILSVLANDEDVKIKDATTSERTWIQNYFEGNDPVGPSAGNFTDLRTGFGSITDQFETDKSITDIGSVFSDSAYDSRSQFFFWSQTVSDDVNGVSRGGFGGGKAPARAPAVPDSTFSDQYEYGDDSIVDAFDFIGGASDG